MEDGKRQVARPTAKSCSKIFELAWDNKFRVRAITLIIVSRSSFVKLHRPCVS